MQKCEYYVFNIKHLTNEDNDEDYMFKHLNDLNSEIKILLLIDYKM